MVEADERFFPIVWLRYEGESTMEDQMFFERHLAEAMEKARGQGRKVVVIADQRKATKTSPAVRQRIAEWIKARSEDERERLVGSIVILDSAIMRGVLTAVGWLAGDRMQGVETRPTDREALDRARTILLDAGEPLPDGLDDALAVC